MGGAEPSNVNVLHVVYITSPVILNDLHDQITREVDIIRQDPQMSTDETQSQLCNSQGGDHAEY